ncbi:MAG TPA: SDR family NAD(P)-dependent oxidoreductase [Bacilli bacterium]
MKTVVITGASSGIGLVTGEYLARKGFKVYGLSRTKGESELITYIACDVTDKNQVESAFGMIGEDIDAVINNAGIGIGGAVEYTSAEDLRRIIDVNIIGVVNVCQVALPYLRKTKGRIINIGSVAGDMAIPFQTFYSVTKAGIGIFSEALNIETRPFGVRVTLVLPGDTKTSFTAHRKKELSEDEIYGKRIKNSLEKMEKDEINGMPPVKVSKVIYKVLRKKNPPIRITVGFSYKILVFLKRFVPYRFLNYVLYKMYGGLNE